MVVGERAGNPMTINAETHLCSCPKLLTGDRPTNRVECHQPRVKCSVPIGGEEQSVEHVHPFRIAGAIGPRLDVAGAKQSALFHTRHGAAAFPVVHQGFAKEALANALSDLALDLGAKDRILGGCQGRLETAQGRLRQRPIEPPGTQEKLSERPDTRDSKASTLTNLKTALLGDRPSDGVVPERDFPTYFTDADGRTQGSVRT